jgi:hypothetical protein
MAAAPRCSRKPSRSTKAPTAAVLRLQVAWTWRDALGSRPWMMRRRATLLPIHPAAVDLVAGPWSTSSTSALQPLAILAPQETRKAA